MCCVPFICPYTALNSAACVLYRVTRCRGLYGRLWRYASPCIQVRQGVMSSGVSPVNQGAIIPAASLPAGGVPGPDPLRVPGVSVLIGNYSRLVIASVFSVRALRELREKFSLFYFILHICIYIYLLLIKKFPLFPKYKKSFKYGLF